MAKRMMDIVEILKAKQREDDKWLLEAVNPTLRGTA